MKRLGPKKHSINLCFDDIINLKRLHQHAYFDIKLQWLCLIACHTTSSLCIFNYIYVRICLRIWTEMSAGIWLGFNFIVVRILFFNSLNYSFFLIIRCHDPPACAHRRTVSTLVPINYSFLLPSFIFFFVTI